MPLNPLDKAQLSSKDALSNAGPIIDGFKALLWEKNGVDFLKSLALSVCNNFEIDCCMIGEFRSSSSSVRTLAVSYRGELQENFEYPLKNTPCYSLLHTDYLVSRGDVTPSYFMQRLAFKQSPVVFKEYFGCSLKSPSGKTLGCLVVLNQGPLDIRKLEQNLLPLASRVGLELDVYWEKQQLYRQVINYKLEEKRAKAIARSVPEALLVVDSDCKVDFANEVSADLFSCSVSQLLGCHIDSLALRTASGEVCQLSLRLQDPSDSVELQYLAGDGLLVLLSLSVTQFQWQGRSFSILVFSDITQLRLRDNELERRRFYDELTGLPNRNYLIGVLEEHLQLAKRKTQYGGVLFIDLDHFKDINDSLGRTAGNQVLERTVETLKEIVGGEFLLAGLGGDEFVITFTGCASFSEARELAQNLAYTIGPMISSPMQVDERELIVTSCIGVALFPDESGSGCADTGEVLLQHADVALSIAKTKGENQVVFYDPDMGNKAKKNLDMQALLYKALQNNEFELYIQPKISAKTGAIAGGESLIRWQRPGVGLVSPAEFIPVLESSGLIVSVGEWVLRESCLFVRKMLDQGLWPEGVPISVNVSPKQLLEPEFEFNVQRILTQFELPPSMLELEVTETVIMENLEEVLPKMCHLQGEGVTFALDDFGTGYSSMVYLKKLPLSTLKIDREFVTDIHLDNDNHGLVQAMLAVSRQFGLKVVAEGVENQEELSILEEMGCDLYQGFYFSRPVNTDDFRAQLAEAGLHQ